MKIGIDSNDLIGVLKQMWRLGYNNSLISCNQIEDIAEVKAGEMVNLLADRCCVRTFVDNELDILTEFMNEKKEKNQFGSCEQNEALVITALLRKLANSIS